MKSCIFHASVRQEGDGRWSAWIDELPGCTSWGYSKGEALEALMDAAGLYIQGTIEEGEMLPKEGVQVVESPVAREAGSSLADELDEIAASCTALPVYDTRAADEIIGYDEHGLPR